MKRTVLVGLVGCGLLFMAAGCGDVLSNINSKNQDSGNQSTKTDNSTTTTTTLVTNLNGSVEVYGPTATGTSGYLKTIPANK